MLSQIPTPHPAITFGSLALIFGIIFYELHNRFRNPLAWWVIPLIFIGISSLSGWSTKRRAKEINRNTRH